MDLAINRVLQQAVTAHKEGKFEEAERLYRAILQSQPLHPDANHNLGVLAVSAKKVGVALPLFKTALKSNPKTEQYWISYIDALIREEQLDNAKQALDQARKQGVEREVLNVLVERVRLIKHAPNATSTEQKKKEEVKKQNLKSIGSSQERLASLSGHYQNGRYDEAETLAVSFTQEFPQNQVGWKLLGIVLRKTGRIYEALAPRQKAAALSPKDPEAHRSLGDTLKELGRLAEAEASYKQAIALKPDFAEASQNLIQLLTTHLSQKDDPHPIIKADQEIKKIDLTTDASEVISDNKVIQLFVQSTAIIKKHKLEIGTDLSQAHRANSVKLNCERHMSIFKDSNIIPKFCFGCYKVQIDVGSLLELIKLFTAVPW